MRWTRSARPARDAKVVIDADLSPSPALGDRVLLERLAVNLLDNAVRYNVTGGSVRVVTGTGHGMSYITVTNTGPLVPGIGGGIPIRAVHAP